VVIGALPTGVVKLPRRQRPALAGVGHVDYDSAMPDLEFNATLVYRQDLNDELSIVRVAYEAGPAPEFIAGQYATLGLPDPADPQGKLIRRPYSIASSPTVREYLEFIIVRVIEGQLTPVLWTVEQGGKLWMDPKIRGTFTLNHAPADKDMLWICTGTGIGPFMAMLRQYRGQGRWRRLIIVHGVRRVEDMGYRQELEAAGRQDPDVLYIPLVSRPAPDSGWEGLVGRVQTVFQGDTYERLTGRALSPEDCCPFLCGNPEMVVSMIALLEQRGFREHTKRNPGNIFVERYWQ
jgi:ferredoxin--NADP+ reductase